MLRDNLSEWPGHSPPEAKPLHAGTLAEFTGWYESRLQQGSYNVKQAPLAHLDKWTMDVGTANITHETGKFFSIEGLHVSTNYGPAAVWSQPIINQPEIGILGILMKYVHGVPQFLLQAKMEPGNINTLQLSPTVQATRSNYTQVHRGARIRHLDFFAGVGKGTVLVDVLQSEHGQWFHKKRNRNMIVETTGDVEEYDDFRWLSAHEINAALQQDNLVNMDTRSVLACLPTASSGPGLHTDAELSSWITGTRTRFQLSTHRMPLREVAGWRIDADEVARPDGSGFRVIGLQVEASGREVRQWSQPMITIPAQGLSAFLIHRIDDVEHVLLHARVDPGHQDVVELGPTVMYTPGDPTPPFLTEVVGAPPQRVRFDTLLSEEGGRLYHAVSRYRIVAVAEDFPLQMPEDYLWLSRDQISRLLAHSNYLNVQARSLIACLRSCP